MTKRGKCGQRTTDKEEPASILSVRPYVKKNCCLPPGASIFSIGCIDAEAYSHNVIFANDREFHDWLRCAMKNAANHSHEKVSGRVSLERFIVERHGGGELIIMRAVNIGDGDRKKNSVKLTRQQAIDLIGKLETSAKNCEPEIMFDLGPKTELAYTRTAADSHYIILSSKSR